MSEWKCFHSCTHLVRCKYSQGWHSYCYWMTRSRQCKCHAPTESRSIRRAVVYGLSSRTILPSLRQFHRRPSWIVNQWEKKCLGIISSLAAGTCWENRRWKGWSDAQTSFKNSNSCRQENILILLVIINSLLSSKDFSLLKSVFLILSLFLLKYRKIPSIPLVTSLN